jgi:hypothetical protein
MNRVPITEVGIDTQGRLYVAQHSQQFPFIYREAMEIQWEVQTQHLCAPAFPRAELWPSIRWFQQIVTAAKAQDCELFITSDTRWVNIPDTVRKEIQSNPESANA